MKDAHLIGEISTWLRLGRLNPQALEEVSKVLDLFEIRSLAHLKKNPHPAIRYIRTAAHTTYPSRQSYLNR